MHLDQGGFQYTAHALARMRQRAIDPRAVECIVDFGRAEHQPGGSSIVYLDREAQQRIRRELGDALLRRLGKRVGAYVVLNGDGTVVTVGHRLRRVKRYS
jgi:hypothetical protein